MGGIRKKKRFARSLTGFLLAGVLGFSCPGVESLAEGNFPGMGSSGCGARHQLGNADCRTGFYVENPSCSERGCTGKWYSYSRQYG